MLLGGGPQKAKGPESGAWSMQQIQISDWKLSIRFPEPFSPDFPVFPIRKTLDLNDPSFKKNLFIKMIYIAWDFRGHFWQGAFGTLSMTVGVKMNNFDEYDLTKEGDLTAYWQELFRRERIRDIEEAEKRHIIPGTAPKYEQRDYQWRAIGTDKWLNYKLYQDGVMSSDHWVHSLDSKHCLLLTFIPVANMDRDSSKSDWRERATKLQEDILSSVKLVK